MRFGCCSCMISPSTDPIGIEWVEMMAGIGFDYVELSLADLAALPENGFAAIVRRMERSGMRCEACHNFFPCTLRLTGGAANLDAALEYARLALDRAGRLGVDIVVFGSSGAKNIPEGFSRAAAWAQLVELLQRLGPIAARHGITIAIEPISRPESNIINLAAEGLRLVRDVDNPNIQLLIDYYHFALEREDPAAIVDAGPAIRHLHFASADGRRFPVEANPHQAQFLEWINETRYAGRCSIEASTQDFKADAPRALRILKSYSRE